MKSSISHHIFWKTILESRCEDILPKFAWKRLKYLSERMIEEDFSKGTEKELWGKTIKALGYESYKELKKTCILESKINFLFDYSKLWNSPEYDETHERIYNDDDAKIMYQNRQKQGENLKKTRKNVVESLGLENDADNKRGVPTLESLLKAFKDYSPEDETPLDMYIRWRSRLEANTKVRQSMLRRRAKQVKSTE